jgi:hypothetical protein
MRISGDLTTNDPKKQKQEEAQEYMKNLKKELEELDSKAKDLTVEFNSVK